MSGSVQLFGKQVSRETMARFKREYEMARDRKAEMFMFDGQEVLVQFAKYVVQYAELNLGAL